MAMRQWNIVLLSAAFALGCAKEGAGPDGQRAPSFDQDRALPGTVIVDPSGRGGAATTIQEGIDRAPPGGRVRVMPGTYNEAVVVGKGLTLEGVGGSDRDDDDDDRGGAASAHVTVTAPGVPTATIEVATPEPVTIRRLTVLKPGVNGILGTGVADVTLEHLTVVAVGTGPGTNRLVRMSNNAEVTGGRARLVVRQSSLDGANLGSLGVSLQADIDAEIDHTLIRRTTICIFVESFSAAGINADIVNNDLDGCGGRTAIDVGPTPTQTTNFGTSGVVNIVGNRIRNSGGSCLVTTAIHYQLYTGRIERNSIIGFLQACAVPQTDALPAAIWVGSLRGFPAAAPVVRFNDIQGNAHAGLRIAPNITTSLDARCNYWGSVDGPSGVGAGTGDAVLIETGGARPVLAPFATGPVSRKRAHGDHDEDDDGDRHAREKCRLEFSLWSEPVTLGGVINTAASEQNPNLSADGLSLYFVSDRAGGAGLLDIWVSRRASTTAAWGAPVNLGPVINSSGNESAPSLSDDGRLLFFFSDFSGRPGALGGQDLYVSRRVDPDDDLAWGAAVNLGPHVNTAADEAGSSYGEGAGGGMAILYFNRRPITVPASSYDIYSVPINRDGLPVEPAAPVAELNTPAGDFGPEVRSDGRELLLTSSRPGTVGGNDLWVSIRRSLRDPWSTPENLGTPINTALNDRHPSLSVDGRRLIFASTRTGTVGSDDLWMSTRTRIGRRDR